MELELKEFALPSGTSGYDFWSRTITDPLIPEERRLQRLQPALIRLTNGLTDEGRAGLRSAVDNNNDKKILWIEGPDEAVLREYLDLPLRQDRQLPQTDGKGFQTGQTQLPDGSYGAQAREAAPLALRVVNAESTFHVFWRQNILPVDLERLLGFFDIVELGEPLENDGAPIPLLQPPAPEILPDDAAIVAVIDDGIGFLNVRFRRDKFHTRFHAIWLQSRKLVTFTPYGQPHPNGGIVLYRVDIDNILALGDALIEGDIYHQINQALLPVSPLFPHQHPSLEFSFTHGSHIADLAAGDDPANPGPAHDWALIGVQLPPDAVNQTAGWFLNSWIRRGMRWVLNEASACSAMAHLNINLSFGAFAGPKNGTGLVEAEIARDLNVWQSTTGRRAQISYAFGNNRLNHMAADYVLKGKLEKIDWCLQPDNRESAFMEIHATPPDNDIELSRLALEVLIPGAGAALALPSPLPNSGVFIIDTTTSKIVAMYVHVPAQNLVPAVTQPSFYLFAVSPTHEHADTTVLAPSGKWELRLQNNDPKPVANPLAVRLEIQRGDTPSGYPRSGRQSYFDHPLAHEWEAIKQSDTLTIQSSYDLAPPNCPITRFGTHSAYVTANDPAALSVAAMRDDPRFDPDPLLRKYIAAPYSALGSPTLGTEPDVAAYGDRSAGRRGLVASGNFSGGGRTGDGTSAAAALATRVSTTIAQTAAPPPPLLNATDKAAFIASIVPNHGVNTNPADRLSLGKVAIFDATGSGSPMWLDPSLRLT